MSENDFLLDKHLQIVCVIVCRLRNVTEYNGLFYWFFCKCSKKTIKRRLECTYWKILYIRSIYFHSFLCKYCACENNIFRNVHGNIYFKLFISTYLNAGVRLIARVVYDNDNPEEIVCMALKVELWV